MSDDNNDLTSKTASIPTGSPKTSAVPLKKETVRITLRARPGAGVTQPREATSPVPTVSTTAQVHIPAAPLPPASAKSPTAPVTLPPAPIPPPGRKTMNVAPAPSGIPAPTMPPPSGARPPAPSIGGAPAPRPPAPSAGGAPAPRPPAPAGGAPAPRPPTGGPPRPAAPSVPGAPRVETGATTQPLSAAPRPPMAGAPRPGATGPMQAGGTTALPKATQKLTASPGGPGARPAIAVPPSAPVKRAAMADSQQFYEEKDPEAGLMPLSVMCFLLAAVLMAVQMLATDKVTSVPAGEDSPLMVPAAATPAWEERLEDGSYRSKFASALPEIPE